MGRPHLPPPPLLDPSWYPDPTGRYEARYWDGRHWTSHISHYGATGTDPLIRARLDRFWIRWLGRAVLWGGLVVVGLWAYQNYWPTDDRDLAADEGIIEGATLVRSNLPAGFGPTAAATLSPAWLEVPDGGPVSPEQCGPLEEQITDAVDEPRDVWTFANDVESSIATSVVVGGDAEFSGAYLDALRSEDGGSCLAAIWVDRLLVQRPSAEVSALTARAMAEPAFGDEAVWWRLSATISGQGFPISVFADAVVVRVDRVVAEYVFESLAEAVPVDVQRDTIRPHVARVRAGVERIDGADDPDERVDDTPG